MTGGVRSGSDWVGLRSTRGLVGFFYMVFPIFIVRRQEKMDASGTERTVAAGGELD